MSEISTKPYLLRAIHEWCTDSGMTPYIAVVVDEETIVPMEFVNDGEIVLNLSTSATNRLVIGNDLIEFQARFGGTARELSIPVDNVSAIYARENGHGMAFQVDKSADDGEHGDQDDDTGADTIAQLAQIDGQDDLIENTLTVAESDDADVASPLRRKGPPALAAVPTETRSAPSVDVVDPDLDPDPDPDPESDPPKPVRKRRRGKATLKSVK